MATKVYEAIAAVTADMARDGISKDRRNQQQDYNFRGIDEVYNALSPVIAKHRLCILPRIVSRDCVERQTQKGGTLFYVTVEAEFDFVAAEDGSKHTVRTFGEAMDSADKATNKAMSAAYKYAAMQAFCIPTEGDNDADATTHEVAPRKSEPAAKRDQSISRTSSDRSAVDWLDVLKAKLKDCVTEGEITALAEKNAKGIAKLEAQEPGLFAEWDHALGMAMANADNVPF